MSNKFKILNVKIDNLTRKEILDRIKNTNGLQIATVNPEFILKAQDNQEFRNILNSEKTLCVADGVGLKFAAWRYGQNLKCRWPGVDLMWEILTIANKKKQKVFLIGNKNGLSTWQETAEAIKKIYPSLEVSGVDIEIFNRGEEDLEFKIFYLTKLQRSGNDLIKDATKSRQSKSDIENLKSYIVNHKADIIFCSLGAPYQEILLNKLRENAKIVMGVGGSFDFITGKVKRAPGFLQKIGLEWLWRFTQEPSYRFKKVWKAIIIFSYKIILYKK